MPRRHRSNRLASILTTLLWLCVVATLLAWAWRLPVMESVRESWHVTRMPPPTELPVPVEGVVARRIADTWGAARSNGRTHQGVDIFAPRGTPVVSSTRGVVSRVADHGLGGKQVWVIGPGGERHYYAHLDGFGEGIARYDIVKPGTLLGYVGDTGNARGTPPHLHYGIYATDGAYNPWPLLQAHGSNTDGASDHRRCSPGSAVVPRSPALVVQARLHQFRWTGRADRADA